MNASKQVLSYLPLYFFLLPLLVLAPAGCSRKGKSGSRAGEVDRLPHLEYVQAKKTRLVLRRSYTATVEPMEKAELTARVRGQVKIMYPNADIGKLVKKDEALVELDVPDIQAEQENKKALLELAHNQCDQAQHALQVAFEEVNEAQAEEEKFKEEAKFRESQYVRYAYLAKKGTIPPQQEDEAKLQMSAAQASVKAVRAKIQIGRAHV